MLDNVDIRRHVGIVGTCRKSLADWLRALGWDTDSEYDKAGFQWSIDNLVKGGEDGGAETQPTAKRRVSNRTTELCLGY
jgi:hypothetical protein